MPGPLGAKDVVVHDDGVPFEIPQARARYSKVRDIGQRPRSAALVARAHQFAGQIHVRRARNVTGLVLRAPVGHSVLIAHVQHHGGRGALRRSH